MSSSRLIYVCDWLPPDFGAVGQYSLHFARDYAREGRDVTLVGLSTSRPGVEQEQHGRGRLTIVRLAGRPYDKTSWLGRMRWTLATDLRLVREVARRRCETDEILFTGAPPFLLHFLVPANLWWRRQLVYRITDFWPECLMAALERPSLLLRAFWRWTCFLRRRVDSFQALGEDQRRRLLAIGIPDERIRIKRDPSPVEIGPDTQPLQRPEELADRIVLLYSGNWGVAHDVDTFVEGYRLHHRGGTGRVGLWLNAVGAGAAEVERRLREEGLPLARSEPVPLDRLASLLVTPDAHLVTLKDAFVGYVLPSKIYGCVASGRPVLFVGSADSDVHRVASEGLSALAYHRVPVGDVEGAARALEAIADLADGGLHCPILAGAENALAAPAV